jgi:CheY-like chemotaxis protein
MAARRALVVDDSRSARAFLTRILERYELAVDGVDSAEQALNYLAQQRPDVIFMDHLMPGMDGFQALTAIKNNPRTATIPIMMYTSQEGELYLSQARALGAIGVLPKQIKHADLSKALDQLKLLGEPKVASAGAVAVKETAATAAPPLPTDNAPPLDLTQERRGPNRPVGPVLPPELRSIIEALVSHQLRELRRFVDETLQQHSERIGEELRAAVQESAQPEATVPEPMPSLPERRRSAAPWLIVLALAAALAFALQWWQQQRNATELLAQLSDTRGQLTQTQRSLQLLQAAATVSAAAAGATAVEDSQGASMSEPVAFGETPLAGVRLDHIAQLLSRLVAQNFHGVIKIRTIPGRYCMVTGPGGVFTPASDTLPYSKCESIGNPRDDNGAVSEWQSVAFANMIATARASAAGRFDIRLSEGTADELAASYPAVSDTLTAGEWNHAAAANNRVELRWQATP